MKSYDMVENSSLSDNNSDSAAMLLRIAIEELRKSSSVIHSVGQRYDELQAQMSRLFRQNGKLNEGQIGIGVRLDNIEHRFDAIDMKFEALDMRFEALERRFDAIDRKFDAVDRRLQAISDRIEEQESRSDQEFRRLNMAFGEMFTLQNQIFDIVNDATHRRLSQDKLSERLDAIESRLGPV